MNAIITRLALALAALAAFLAPLVGLPSIAHAQESNSYQADCSRDELSARRARLYNAIGAQAIAVVQGAAGVPGFSVFRQSNEFYYLSGVESAHGYLLLNGRARTTTLYLPRRDEGRERSEGRILSVEDSTLLVRLTGVDRVRGMESLAQDLVSADLLRPPAMALYTPLAPMETGNDSRDELLAAQARAASDPWDGRPSREAQFVQLVKARFPQFEIRDLSPALDAMRSIKSPAEIALIRRATQLAGLGIMEAMRSTTAGVYEYQLDAAAKYVFQHPVGMAVHDVGRVRGLPLQAGMVFTIDPMIWIPEEQLYIRIEDVALVTADGVENLSGFVPSRISDVQRTIAEPGLVQWHKPMPVPPPSGAARSRR